MEEIVPVPRLDPIYTYVITDAEDLVQEIVAKKDFEHGFDVIRRMLVFVKAADDSIGVVLNGMNKIWNSDEHEGEKFLDAIRRETGLSPVTVYRHLRIQEALPLIPEDYREEIQGKGEKEKIQIANVVHGGYEITDGDWIRLAEAVDEKEVGRITREIKGVGPRSNWLAISIDDRGVLRVHTTRGVRECGRLYVSDDDLDVQKAIARLTGCSGVQPASEY